MKKENNKYYIPTIEEFHVEFEYEIMVPEAKLWSKETFYLNKSHIDMIKYVNIQDEYTKNKIRVKYLDREDIESLGFKLQPSLLFKKGNIFISFGHEKYIQINNAKDVFFQGIIKNKSELKRLLKQLKTNNNE